MRIKVLIALVGFILLEGGLIVYAFREIERIALEKGLSPFSWKIRAFFSMLGLSLLVGLFCTGLFLIFEVELFWLIIPILISAYIAFLLLRRNLKKKEASK